MDGQRFAFTFNQETMPRGPGNVNLKHISRSNAPGTRQRGKKARSPRARFCMQWRAKKILFVKNARGGCQMEIVSLELLLITLEGHFQLTTPSSTFGTPHLATR